MPHDPNLIFCKDCIFFREGERIPFSFGPPEFQEELCLAPQNFKDTHRAHSTENKLPTTTPRIINRFNDCRWFVPFPDDSSSSSSSVFIQLKAGDIYTFSTSSTLIQFEYLGGTGTSALIILIDESFAVGNIGGDFVWDIGGDDEHTFTVIGESITQLVNGTSFVITYDGPGSLLFTVVNVGESSSSSSSSIQDMP